MDYRIKINKNSIRLLTEKYRWLHYILRWEDGLNFKLQEEAEKNPENYVLGASPLVKKVLQEDGNWTPFFGENERQSGNLESMACFPYDAEVLMEDFNTKRISEIKNGDYVITHLGNKKKVIKTFKRDYDKEIYKLKIRGIYKPITCTPNHPILTKDGWKETEKLTTNDYVAMPFLDNITKDATIKEIEKNKDFLWLLGFYIAEGSLVDRPRKINKDNNIKLRVRGSGEGDGMIEFSIHKKEIYFAEKITRIVKELFGIETKIYYKKNSLACSVRCYNIFLSELLKQLGGKFAVNKKIADRLMVLEPSLQLEILKGWLDGDGWKLKDRKVIGGITISKNLVYQFARILLRNKIKFSLQKKDAYENHQASYSLLIYGDEINKLFEQKEDNEKYLYRKISIIEKTNIHNFKKVYNLEIEDDNSYIVNFVAVHNCTCFSFLNIVEALEKRKFNNTRNWSDRFSAVMSGVTKNGNSMDNVLNSARKLHGLLNQEDWLNDVDELNWYEFYKTIPMDIQQKAMYFLDEYEIGYESVPATIKVLKEQIKYSPIYCAGYAWYPKGDTYYSFGGPNHAFVIQRFDGNNPIAKDSYEPFDKKLDVNFRLYYTKIITLNKKNATYDLGEIKKLMDRGFKYIMRADKINGGHGEIYELTPNELIYKTAEEARDIGLNTLEKRGDYTGVSEKDYYNLIN